MAVDAFHLAPIYLRVVAVFGKLVQVALPTV